MKPNKKVRLTSRIQQQEEGEDRISDLPDKLIHQILWFSNARSAVQTSLLSKRWKLIWTTLPFLNFFMMNNYDPDFDFKFTDHLITHRNHDSEVLKLNLIFQTQPCIVLANKVIDYAIAHHVEQLNVNFDEFAEAELSRFSSPTIKKLTVSSAFYDEHKLVLGCWDLPVLTTLHLICPCPDDDDNLITLPQKYLTCLPCLQTLLLEGCVLPKTICLPTLTSLTLNDVEFTDNVSEFFGALVNLRNLSLRFRRGICADFVVNCPQLVNLEIVNYTDPLDMISDKNHKVMVSAPNIRNFSSVNICPITCGVVELENVNVKLDDNTFEYVEGEQEIKEYFGMITDMFLGLSGAKILTLNLNTIEVLSVLLNSLLSPPPFYNLEYVKVPHGYNKSSMSTNLRSYLLGCSPKAAIVTTLPQKTVIPQTQAVPLTAHTVVLQKPLAAPTTGLVGSENMRKTVCVNTLDVGVQEEHVVQNSVVNADRGTQISVPVQGTGNERASSSTGNSHVGLWQGHVVTSEFVCLLDLIMNKYPETFELFTTINKKLSSMKLNMLGSSVSAFTKISMTQVDTEMIAEHRIVFDALQKLGFNVSWLVNRLNYIEQLRFSQPLLSELHAIDSRIDNAKSKLQDLQIRIDETRTELQDLHTLHAEKMQQIQKATLDTNLLVGYIGDDLLPGF